LFRVRAVPALDRYALAGIQVGRTEQVTVTAVAEPAYDAVAEIKDFTGLRQRGVHLIVVRSG
jgi:hypothetical protein